MKKAILAITLAACTFAPALRAEDLKYPPINPALLYWQAAAELPKLTDEQARDLRGMASGRNPFEEKKAGELLHESSWLRLAEMAANSTVPCDWGLPLAENGPATALPHMSKMQEMAALTVLQAETSFSQGQTKDGIKWLLMTHRMARHAGVGDIPITFLVQNMIETNAIRTAARHCLTWDEETRQAYATALKALPTLHTAHDAVHGEHTFIDWVERRLLHGLSESDLAVLKSSIYVWASDADDKEIKEAFAAQLKPEAMQATITEWRGLQKRLETALAKPWLQGRPEIETLNEEIGRSPHILIRHDLPSLGGLADTLYMLLTLRTMLEAALEHGPKLDEAVASSYRDALEGEPLRSKKAADGTLSLVAAHEHPAGKDKLLSLRFGK